MLTNRNEKNTKRTWGRFPTKGKGKRMASKYLRRLAKLNIKGGH